MLHNPCTPYVARFLSYDAKALVSAQRPEGIHRHGPRTRPPWPCYPPAQGPRAERTRPEQDQPLVAQASVLGSVPGYRSLEPQGAPPREDTRRRSGQGGLAVEGRSRCGGVWQRGWCVIGAFRSSLLVNLAIGADLRELMTSPTRSLGEQASTPPLHWANATDFPRTATPAVDLEWTETASIIITGHPSSGVSAPGSSVPAYDGYTKCLAPFVDLERHLVQLLSDP